MYRHKQIGALLAGDFSSATQRDEVVARTGQLSPEAFHAIDLALQLFGNRQYHVFFTLALGARGARVFAAVAGINHHHNAALATGNRRQLDIGLCGSDRHYRYSRHIGRRQTWGWINALVIQVHNQPIAILRVRRKGEALGRDRFFQVNHHPQIGWGALR